MESTVKMHRPLITIVALLVMFSLLAICPKPSTLISSAYAKESLAESKIISDTLAAHKVTCLSRNGLIITVLLDGKWVDVKEVELVNRTLILRTKAGTLSLAAVIK